MEETPGPPRASAGWRRTHLEIDSSFHMTSGVSRDADLRHHVLFSERNNDDGWKLPESGARCSIFTI